MLPYPTKLPPNFKFGEDPLYSWFWNKTSVGRELRNPSDAEIVRNRKALSDVYQYVQNWRQTTGPTVDWKIYNALKSNMSPAVLNRYTGGGYSQGSPQSQTPVFFNPGQYYTPPEQQYSYNPQGYYNPQGVVNTQYQLDAYGNLVPNSITHNPPVSTVSPAGYTPPAPVAGINNWVNSMGLNYQGAGAPAPAGPTSTNPAWDNTLMDPNYKPPRLNAEYYMNTQRALNEAVRYMQTTGEPEVTVGGMRYNIKDLTGSVIRLGGNTTVYRDGLGNIRYSAPFDYRAQDSRTFGAHNEWIGGTINGRDVSSPYNVGWGPSSMANQARYDKGGPSFSGWRPSGGRQLGPSQRFRSTWDRSYTGPGGYDSGGGGKGESEAPKLDTTRGAPDWTRYMGHWSDFY